MDELEIRLVLRFSVPKDGLTVNGILQGAICDVLLFWKKGGGRKRDGT